MPHWLHEQGGLHPEGGGVCIGGGGESSSGILQDMVNKQVVRILLECILVLVGGGE